MPLLTCLMSDELTLREMVGVKIGALRLSPVSKGFGYGADEVR